MKLVIGGSIAIIIGVYGFATNLGAFLGVLAAIIPITLILGGCLAIYLNYETTSKDVEETSVDQDSIIIQENPSETKPAEKKPKISTDEPGSENPEFVGNTGSLVLHNSDCKFSKSERCTVFFNTREKAIQEGYKPCGICKP
jgi:hypothetical protein